MFRNVYKIHREHLLFSQLRSRNGPELDDMLFQDLIYVFSTFDYSAKEVDL